MMNLMRYKRVLGLMLWTVFQAAVVSGDGENSGSLFMQEDLVYSFGGNNLSRDGYSFQDRQPLASFEAPDGTLWQVVGYISLNRLPVLQWRHRAPDSTVWSLWARIGQDPDVLPATGSNWHGFMSVGIDTAGYVHFAYDGRLNAGRFRFYRSDVPVHQGWSGGLVNRSDDGLPGWSSTTGSTYWRFSKHPQTGELTLAMRQSSTGHSLFVLDAETRAWSAFPGTPASNGRLFFNNGLFAHYVAQDVVFRGDDVFVGYSERQSGDATTNEDLSVVMFNGSTGQWQRLDGTVLSTPIGRRQGTVVDPSKTGSMLDHRWDMMADGQGRVHGFYRRLRYAPDAVPEGEVNSLQIFHFWIDGDNQVHGPRAITNFTDYTEFWQNVSGGGVALSQARSFFVGDTVFVAWQERNHGQRVRAMAARYPFTAWSDPVEIDDINLRMSDPEFERWAWDSRGELWLTAMPFLTDSAAGRPVTVRQIDPDTLPRPPGVFFSTWIENTTVPVHLREPLDRNGPLQISNLEAYALGVDPMQATREDLMRIVNGTGGTARVRFTRNSEAEGVNLRVEVSNDLSEWITLEEAYLQTLEADPPRETVEVTIAPDGSGPLFFRLVFGLD